MKHFLLVLMVFISVFPMLAQDEGCEIDLSGVTSLLEQAQAVAEDDAGAALDLLAEVRAAIEAIENECAADLPVTLGATFEAPDNSFSFEYPEGWELGEYDTLGDDGGLIYMGSSADVLDEIPNADPDPALDSGEQLLAILLGTPSAIAASQTNSLETTIGALSEDLKDEYPNLSGTEYFTLNDRRAGTFEFSGATFHSIVMVIEYQRGEQYAALVGVAAPEEADLLRPLITAVAETIRIEN